MNKKAIIVSLSKAGGIRSGACLNRRKLLQVRSWPTEPQEGAYWWIPMPYSGKGTRNLVPWALLTMFASEFENVPGETLHPERWPDALALLSRIWKKHFLTRELPGCHQGLPRGRIALNNEGGYSIDHGENHPLDTCMTTVAGAFGIPLVEPNRIEIYDPRFFHYDLDLKALSRLENSLGVNLNLRYSKRL